MFTPALTQTKKGGVIDAVASLLFHILLCCTSMRHRVPMSTWYDQLVGTVQRCDTSWGRPAVEVGKERIRSPVELSTMGYRLSVCAGLLDGADLGVQGGPHRGGEGAAGEQCQPGTSRHGEEGTNGKLYRKEMEDKYHYSLCHSLYHYIWLCMFFGDTIDKK